jgi:dihydroxyacetone kinase-like protein
MVERSGYASLPCWLILSKGRFKMAEGEALTNSALLQALKQIAARMRDKSEQLRDLDAACGDGDLGVTVTKGFTAVEKRLPALEGTSLAKILKTVGMAFNNAAASTFGVFFATAFMNAGKAVASRESMDIHDLCTMIQAAVQGVSQRGKAKIGDKTILDALVPASDAFCQASQNGVAFLEALKQAVAAAKKGAEGTKGMLPKVGRARWLGEKAREVQDPGATFVYLFLNECLASLSTLLNSPPSEEG